MIIRIKNEFEVTEKEEAEKILSFFKQTIMRSIEGLKTMNVEISEKESIDCAIIEKDKKYIVVVEARVNKEIKKVPDPNDFNVQLDFGKKEMSLKKKEKNKDDRIE